MGHKEQIKTLKTNVDVLTLTATPIPRTLHMSMIGIRDMSVIDTPPEDRYPVQTYVLEYSDTLLCDAIRKELSRGGQCYIVYNQVPRMERYAGASARTAARGGHRFRARADERAGAGARDAGFYGGPLQRAAVQHHHRKRLDIANVNTLFVLEADRMGLSQLYQLRGRVGRSSRLGYAYFTFMRDKALTEVAQKRLMALTEFAQFGAGREIALRDLEIRGAGSLLGAQQHGHIADIGYEYYTKLMSAAVREARGEPEAPPEVDTTVDVPIAAHIPRGYIKSEVQRLSMYKRIALITGRDMLFDVQEEMEDRFGDIRPPQAEPHGYRAGQGAVRSRADTDADRARARRAWRSTSRPARRRAHAAGLVTFGAQILPGETVSLLYKKADADVEEMLRALPPLLEALGGCV